MTDSQKLDLLLEKVSSIDDRLNDVESELNGLKRQQMKSTAELKAMDEMIFDEAERVHIILEKHKNNDTKHIA